MKLTSITLLCVAPFLVLANSSLGLAQVDVFDAGQGRSFNDIGFDSASQEIVAVGSDGSGVGAVASVFHLSSDHSVFGSTAVTGLGPSTTVSGVSPNGLVISGSSNTSATDNRRIGVAWQRAALGDPVTAGDAFSTPIGTYDDVVPVDAWNGGVVGSVNAVGFPSNFVFRTNSSSTTSMTSFTDGPYELEFEARVNDVSGDGTMTVGSIGDAFLEEGVIWDEVGNTTRFDDTQFNAVSPNGNLIGGIGDIASTGGAAQIWRNGPNGFEAEGLTVHDDLAMAELLLGSVDSISDSGYAIGRGFEFSSGSFIWHESFNGIDSSFLGAQDFDEWLVAVGGESLPTDSFSLAGVIEQDRVLHFAVNGDDQAFIVSVSTVPEPGSAVVLLFAISGALLRRKRS